MTTGRSGTRLHTIWKGIKARCQTPTHTSYPRYGAKGIKVCAEWQTFVGFLDWALANGYADHLQVDRLDVSGHYEPENCRWTTPQLNNARRELDGTPRGCFNLDGKLTQETIDAAIGAGEAATLNDGSGLRLMVRPGGVSSWQFRYRRDRGENIYTIGRYPAVSLDDAREWAEVLRARVKRGADPAKIRQATKARFASYHRDKRGYLASE